MLTLQAIGNLGADPEQKQTQGGTDLVRMSMAVNKKVKGEKHTTWLNITIFDKHKIDFAMRYLRKGAKVFIEGEPAARGYEANGEARASLDVVLGFGSKLEICSTDMAEDNRGSGAANSQDEGDDDAYDDLDADDIPF